MIGKAEEQSVVETQEVKAEDEPSIDAGYAGTPEDAAVPGTKREVLWPGPRGTGLMIFPLLPMVQTVTT